MPITELFHRLNERLFVSRLKTVDESYISKRVLHDNWISKLNVTLCGVGIVILGEYSGWNFGLSYGWGSLIVASVIINVYYWCLLLCLSELSSAMPFSGGVFTFTAASMGNVFSYIIGLMTFMKILLAYSQTVLVINNYYIALANFSPDQIQIWKYFICAFIILICSILTADLKIFYRVMAVISGIAILGIVAVFFLLIPIFARSDFLANIGILDWSTILPDGITGVLNCIPYAIWIFIGIEDLPNIAEEVKNPSKNLPKGILYGFLIISILGFMVLIMTGANPGINVIQTSAEPIFDLLTINYAINAESFGGQLLRWILTSGAWSTLIGVAMSNLRITYSLSRGGYFPTYLSLTYQNGDKDSIGYGSPIYATIFSGLGCYGMVIVSFFLVDTNMITFFIYGSAFYSVTASIIIFTTYIILKVKSPHLDRPFTISNTYISLGVPILGLGISFFAIAGFFISNPNNEILLWTLGIQIIVSVLYYIFFVRHRLIMSVEQKFIKARISKMKDETIRKHQMSRAKNELHTVIKATAKSSTKHNIKSSTG
ncbi:amino acid permease-domain-containing protein [Globomyces pollinis-pini]|nr:amino acid permease-domain-containing protein [Globomyces pollinis-pini]